MGESCPFSPVGVALVREVSGVQSAMLNDDGTITVEHASGGSCKLRLHKDGAVAVSHDGETWIHHAGVSVTHVLCTTLGI